MKRYLLPFLLTFLAGGGAGAQTQINDTDPAVIYSAVCCTGPENWNYVIQPGDYQNDEHRSNLQRPGGTAQGASTIVAFNGTAISWIGSKTNTAGIAAVSVDGSTPQMVDNYSPTTQFQQILFSASGLPPGPHALMIEVTPNSSSGDFFQIVDAFATDGTFLTLDGATGFINYQNATVTSGWTCGAQPGNVGGGFCWSFNPGDTWGGSFTGSLFELFGHPDAEDGPADVWIDGAPYTTIYPVFGTIDDDALASYPMLVGTLAPGDHTIQIIVGGNGTQATQIDSLVSYQ